MGDAVAAEVAKDKAQRRATLRAEFWKQTTNPHRHATMEGGSVFDPAVQRYLSTKVSNYDYFKGNAKTSKYALSLTIIPMLVYGYAMYKERAGREHLMRTGQVAYRDRTFKFI